MNVRRMNKSKSQCPYLLPSREKALIPRNRYWAALGFLPRLPISRDFRFPQANDGICHQPRIVQLFLSLKTVGKTAFLEAKESRSAGESRRFGDASTSICWRPRNTRSADATRELSLHPAQILEPLTASSTIIGTSSRAGTRRPRSAASSSG